MGLFTKNWRDLYRRLSDRELLEYIRNGDQHAKEYLWITYHDAVATHMKAELKRYGKPPQLGREEEYAHDAILELLEKAHLKGASVLNEYSHIKGWLKQAATNFMRNALRKDERNERDLWLANDDDDEPRSRVEIVEDKGADAFADMPLKDRSQIIQDVLAGESKELQNLLRFKYMDGFSWQETAALLKQFYPDHDPPFTTLYTQQTYWDRVNKKPFRQKLRDALKRYGYDL